VTLNLLNADMKTIEPILQTIKLIFKMQKNIQSNVDVLHLEADTAEHCFRFELHGRNELRDETRIVTLGIGESSGSKSKCFLLIYDDKMAVVVPPSISDVIEVAESSKSEETLFAEYLDAIQFCKKIAVLLSGGDSAQTAIPCLVPSLELVIRKIEPSFNEGILQIDPDDACINLLLLKRKKYLRHCFKIGEKYVFFMHLVKKGAFLGNILATIHAGIREKADACMQEYSRILENVLVSAYNPDDLIYRETHWDKIYAVYRNYADAIKNLPTYPRIKRTGLDTRIFLEYVQGRFSQNNIDSNGTSAQGELKSLLDEIFRKPNNSNILEEFKRQQTAYIQDKVDSRYMNGYLEVIVWNYLDLLVRLRRRKVAIRDIKPENIFLRRELRAFSDNDDNFIFGLIDLETAINLGAEGELAQPLTIGTPYYVQPTTFVKNEILRLTYRDKHLARIYYMQDWHSVTALIYYAVTGETLFNNSAKLLLDEFYNRYASLTSDKIDTKDIISMLNVFWPNAIEEFNYKITKNRHVLEIIRLDISDDIWELLLGEIESNVQSIKEKLRTASDSFHPDQIQCLARMEIAELKKSLQPFKEEGDEAITCLLQIIECQEREQYYDQCIHKLNTISKRMTIYELLTFMFAVEYDFFFPEELRAAAVKKGPLKKTAFKGDKTLRQGTTQKKTKTRSNKSLRTGALQ
jgi:serine/threonine protein kinase